MTKQEFINQILESIDSEDTATVETSLIDVEPWDSLASMVTISLAADNFGVILKAPQLRECYTFDDICKLIGDENFV